MVVAKGKKVTNVNVGQQVVSLHWSPCMTCKACRIGKTTLCENGLKSTFLGVSTNGGYAEYVKNKCMGFVPLPPHQYTALEAAPVSVSLWLDNNVLIFFYGYCYGYIFVLLNTKF